MTFRADAQTTTTYTWNGGGGTVSSAAAAWSKSANWLGGAAPSTTATLPPYYAGLPSSLLAFVGSGTQVSDMGTGYIIYTVGGVTFRTRGTDSATTPDLTVENSNSGGGALQLAGSGTGSASIVMDNSGSVLVSVPLAPLTDVTVSGTGGGNLTLDGIEAVTSPAKQLILDQTSATYGYDGGALTLAYDNGYSSSLSNISLYAGNLVLNTSSSGHYTPPPLYVYFDGTYTPEPTTVTFTGNTYTGPISDGAYLTIGRGATNGIASGAAVTTSNKVSGVISGAGEIDVTPGNIFYSTGTATFTGNIVLLGGANPAGLDPYATTDALASQINGYGLVLSGAGGSFASAHSITIDNHAVLDLANLTATTNSTNRISDSASIALHGGRITYVAASGAANSEAFGNVTLDGGAILTLETSATTGSTAALTFGTLARQNHGTLLVDAPGFYSPQIGGGAPTANRGNIYFGGTISLLADPSGSGAQDTGIVPYMAGALGGAVGINTGYANTLATYDSNGVSLLSPTSTTYFNVLSAAGGTLAPHVNNSLINAGAQPAGISGALTVNSLVVDSDTTYGAGHGTLYGATGDGSDKLTLYSGVLVNGAHAGAGTLTVNNLNLAFGTSAGVPGYLYGGDTILTGTSRLSGTGGLAAYRRARWMSARSLTVRTPACTAVCISTPTAP